MMSGGTRMKPETPCSRCGERRDRTGEDGRPIQAYCARCRREYKKERWEKNSERMTEIQKRSHAKLKTLVIKEYGGKCKCCGKAEPLFLTLDHVFNDGAAERKELFGGSRGGLLQYRLVKKLGFPQDRYQLLCRNCNWAKFVEGSCPHQRQIMLKEAS